MDKASKRVLLISFGSFLVLFCPLMLLLAQSMQSEARNLLANGERSPAVVERKDYTPGAAGRTSTGGRTSSRYSVTVTFTGPMGKRQLATSDKYIGPREWNPLRRGDTVEVVYRREQPYNFCLRSSLENLLQPFWWRWLAAFGVVDGIGLIVAATRLSRRRAL